MAFCNETFMPSEVSGEQEDYSVVADSWLAEIRRVQKPLTRQTSIWWAERKFYKTKARLGLTTSDADLEKYPVNSGL